MSHPNVEQAVVFGVPDAFEGEKIAALYTGNVIAHDLHVHCRQWLPAYKLPVCLQIDLLPVLGNGKIDRLRAQKYYEALSKENGNDD